MPSTLLVRLKAEMAMREIKQALSVSAVLVTILVGAYLLAPPAHAQDNMWASLENNGYVLSELPASRGWVVSYLSGNPMGCQTGMVSMGNEKQWVLVIFDVVKNKVVSKQVYSQRPGCFMVEVRTA